MTQANVDLLKNTAALTLTIRSWSNKRMGKMDEVETSADKSRLKLTKQLIDSKEYDLVISYLNETRAWVLARTMPFFGFKAGIYLAKLSAIETIEAELPERLAKLQELVGELEKVYPVKIEEAREKLNGQFNLADYPREGSLSSLFGIQWNWIAFSVPEGLPPEIRQAEEAKLKERFAQAQEEITAALREGFATLVSHATEKLKSEPGEKVKTFRDSLIGNIQEFIDTFSFRNLNNDQDLAFWVGKASEIVKGLNPDTLRKDETLRAKVKAQFDEVNTALSGMIAEKPSRKFNLED